MSRKTRIIQLKAEAASLDLEETKEQLLEYKKKFEEDFSEELQFLRWKQEQQKPIEKEEVELKIEATEDISKLYRSIARLSHPDICDDEEKNDYFRRAATAYKDGDWSELLFLANACGVDSYEMSVETMIMIEEQIEKMEKEVLDIKQRVAWVWGSRPEGADEEALSNLMLKSLKVNPEEFRAWKEQKENGTLGRT